MDRRNFIAISGAATLLGASQAKASNPPSTAGQGGRSIADFGVTPNVDRDQTFAFQKAIDEIAAAGQPAFVPPGRYAIASLTLPHSAALIGVSGYSVLVRNSDAPLILAEAVKNIRLSGLTLDGKATVAAKTAPLILINGGNAIIDDVTFSNAASEGLSLVATAAHISRCRAERCFGTAIKLRQALAATITDGIFETVGTGIDYEARATAAIAIISGNRVRKASQTGIVVSGNAKITGNVVEDATEFGLRLGGTVALGTFSAIDNMVKNAGVGIGVSNADGGYGVVTLNMISGAKNGGIRALNEGAITGPDLARSSPEAFRNLAIAGNVSV